MFDGLLPFAVYDGSRFVRYVRAASRAEALGFARELIGSYADAVQPDHTHNGKGPDKYGFYSWNAPSAAYLQR